MIHIFYGIGDLNLKTTDGFLYSGIRYFKKKNHTHLRFNIEILLQSNKINRYTINNWLNKSDIF